ncbi:MAG TPA: hypothetical protein VEA99_12525 [Gemmatimonadaceae bacterium]|nr:hypothetical protein [Gemmatimonadaceae bacterium]
MSDATAPGQSPGEHVQAELGRVFRRAVRGVLVLTAVLVVGGGLVGWLVADLPGLWGGLLGGVVGGVVAGATPATMLATARSSTTAALGGAVASWLVAALVLVGAIVGLRATGAVHMPVFGATVVVGLIAAVAVQMRAALTGRVPHVDPGTRPPAA